MAQNKKQAAKRKSRAARREAEEAAEKAAQEQAAKERKQQTIIGAIVVFVIVALVAVIGVVIYRNIKATQEANISVSEAYSRLQSVSDKPSTADDKGGFLMSKNGYNTSVDGAPTVAVYMDPMCPGCGNFNRTTDATLISMMNAGQINLEIYPMSFMDRYSTDEYSSRVSGAIAYIASHDSNPDHLLNFISNIYAEDFQPSESSYKAVSDDAIIEQATKAGVSEDIAKSAMNREYQDWLDAINVYTPKREELWNTSGSSAGSMTTPAVTINGTIINTSDMNTAQMGWKDAVLASIGLEESQVGQSTMPSIGSTGKPISLTTGQ